MSECACNKQGEWNTAGTHLDLFLGLSSMVGVYALAIAADKQGQVSEHDNGTLVCGHK